MIARMDKEKAALKKEMGLGDSDEDDPEMADLTKQLKKPRKQIFCLYNFEGVDKDVDKMDDDELAAELDNMEDDDLAAARIYCE
jgi:hypothetical protein